MHDDDDGDIDGDVHVALDDANGDCNGDVEIHDDNMIWQR